MLQDYLRDKSNFVSGVALDGCDDKKKKAKAFDAVGEAAANYTIADLKIKAASAVQQWVEDDVPLGEGETQADRLYSLLLGIADVNHDGEISDDEADAYNMVASFAWDYLALKGADEGDIDALLNEWDSDAADRIHDLVQSTLPDGDDADDEINEFAFSTDDEGAVFDAVYKMKVAFQGGKKVKIKKRISGTVRRSGAQKAAMKKAQMKSHSAGAMMKRAKSMMKRKKAGF
jgi:hypothetical protein